MSHKKLNRFDWLLLCGLILLTIFYLSNSFDDSLHPFEDAAILMRYAKHFSQGHGIVWNIGEKPVDGATDFLYMIFLGLLAKTGLSLELASRLISSTAHLLTVTIIYVFIRKFYQGTYLVAFISAVFLAMGPARFYIALCFGTPFFALFACVTWCYAVSLVKDPASKKLSLSFALSGLIMGLIRPEGVFLATFMLLSVLYKNGYQKSRKTILFFIGTFLTLGGTYFIWRWNYFGYPLPNPFYKKGGGILYINSLDKSINNVINLCLPFMFVFTLGLRSFKAAKEVIFSLIPIVGFTIIWILLSNDMNYLSRFQYAILPVVLLSWPPLVKGLAENWQWSAFANEADWESQITLITIIMMCFFGIIFYQYNEYKDFYIRKDSRYDVAKILEKYSNRNYVIATTEAGLLPFYSNWRTIDAWGLNDQWITHNGGITESYLARYQPQLIVYHFKYNMKPKEKRLAWNSTLKTLTEYAIKNGYILAGSFGANRSSYFSFFVDNNFPDSWEIIQAIRNMDHYYGRSKFINLGKVY